MPEPEHVRILYMEDNAGLARLFQKRLRNAGYTVDIAHDGGEGLAMYAEGSYDVLAVDQNMPIHNGLEVIRILASQGSLPPTIMVTGAGNEQTAIQAMKLGARDYIVKDVDLGYLDLLPTVIEQVLQQQRTIEDKQRAQQALREYSEKLEEMVEQRTKELRDAQEKLVRREKLAAIGQFGASVGHELRNPLGVIKNSMYYLKMKLGGADEKVLRHIAIVEREIARSNKIISDLLGFARVKAPELTVVEINTLAEEALSRSFVPDNVAMITNLAIDLPPLMADADQIIQVFINLISNAIQAMSDEGTLEITTEVANGFIVTHFRDQGCGIPEENMRKLFEPLFTTKAKGIGLGLALIKTLVEGHKGTIEVESEVGKGTTFSVRLPANQNKGEPEEEEAAKKELSTSRTTTEESRNKTCSRSSRPSAATAGTSAANLNWGAVRPSVSPYPMI